MADKRSNFNKRIEAIHLGAQAMRNLCIESQFDSQTGMFLTDDNSRGAAILSAIANEPMFESVSQETAVGIVSGMQSAVREYEKTYGHLPSDELMASAHATMRNMMTLEGAKRDGSTGAMMLESINQSLSTSEGVEIRAKMVGLVLPVLLETATLDAVTMIPAGANEVEIFKVYRRTGSNFGDFAAGTEIDQATVGQYSSMRQRYKFVAEQQPDGTKTTHVFDSKTDLQHTKFEIPFTKTSVSLFINHKRVARDLDSNGSQIMTGTHNGMVINCQIDHAKGKVTVTPTSALPAGTILHIEFEVDIERRPDLIPTIDHDMDSRTLRPRQNAIAADATIQAMFTMQREFGQDLKSLQMSHMRNTLAS
ncbi:hypothetical protein WMQ49_20325, partial [Vibrio diabolicus]|uniref:hypothetical protein n=2 Tax=Vibrionaceae TaxID=641 RepID=UPI003750BD10